MQGSEDMRDAWKDIIDTARSAVDKAGLSCSIEETHSGMFDISVSGNGTDVGVLSLIFRRDRFDALLWDGEGHIAAGSSGIGYGRADDRIWVMADVERALRTAAARLGILSHRDVPSDFVLDVLVHDVARLPMPWEEEHAWAVSGPQAPSVVREARDIVSSGRFDRERCLRFAKNLAEAVPNIDHRRDGAGYLMMAKRCKSALEGRAVLPIYEYQWQSRAFSLSPSLPDHAVAVTEADADAPTKSPSP